MTLRFATAKDVDTILDLIWSLAVYEKLEHEVTGSAKGLEKTLFGDHPYAEVILAEEHGQSAGFALFFHNYSTFLCKPGIYLEDLYVRPEHRGKGIGLALISAVAKIAKERNCGRVEWSVLDWNEPSIEFYKSLGGKPQDGWTVFRVTGDKINEVASASPATIG